ncbi:TNF receptor-associated factor 5-like [Amblyomma americanum]
MTPGSQQYTLVGFSDELDWRPLRFVKPLPPNRVCSACGLVRPKSALLPCGHTLCARCSEQCSQEGLHICPLDGYECQDELVDWRESASEELLRREVKCWNKESGCQYVAAASGIVQHFQRECRHHPVCCPKCSATVACSNVIAHLTSGLCNPTQILRSQGANRSGHNDETALAASFRGALDEHAGEIREFLGRIVSDVSTHGDRLNEISHAINSLKEAQVTVGERQHQDSLTQIQCEIHASKEELKQFLTERIGTPNLSGSIDRLEKTLKDEMLNVNSQIKGCFSQVATAVEALRAASNENGQKAVDYIKTFLRHTKVGLSYCRFSVKSVRSLQTTALEEGSALYKGEMVYLRGYFLSPGVYLKKNGKSVLLHAWLRLHKSDMDDFVQWPFGHKVKLSVLHPGEGAERVVEELPAPSYERFQRPTSASNLPVHFQASLNLNSLISDGYIEDDQLHVKYELLP